MSNTQGLSGHEQNESVPSGISNHEKKRRDDKEAKIYMRYLQAAGFVAVYISLGFLLKLSPYPYLFIGIPLALLFQHFICRKPIHQAWLREGERFHLNKQGIIIGIVLCLYPAKLLVYKIANNQWDWITLSYVVTLSGAFPAAYCVSKLTKQNITHLLLCLAISGTIGSLLFVLQFILTGHHDLSAFERILKGVKSMLLLFPICFVVEEVVFRGVIDAHVYRNGERKGFLSAFFVSAIWGLWHLPVSPMPPDINVPVGVIYGLKAIAFIVVHSLIGIPLSIFWRKSGNLAVPSFTHAFIDSVRNALVGHI